MWNFDAEPTTTAELQNGDSFVETGSDGLLFVVRKGAGSWDVERQS